MDNTIRSVIDAILIIMIIAQSVYLGDKYKILSKKVDNLSALLSDMNVDVNYKTLKKLNLNDEDIEKVLKLFYEDKKLEAIKILKDLKDIDHMEAYNIINKLI